MANFSLGTRDPKPIDRGEKVSNMRATISVKAILNLHGNFLAAYHISSNVFLAWVKDSGYTGGSSL